MFLQRGTRAIRVVQRQCSRTAGGNVPKAAAFLGVGSNPRLFHTTGRLDVVKPVLLADIGEGIVECEVIQWFVQPGARVEEFSPLCEVQSDKASVEITSRFAGVVKTLHYEAGDMAKVGKPFVDIDIEGGAADKLDSLTAAEPEGSAEKPAPEAVKDEVVASEQSAADPRVPDPKAAEEDKKRQELRARNGSIATPAVRHLSREHKVDISQISGTGKDGRVLKEDVHRFVKQRDAAPAQPAAPAAPRAAVAGAPSQQEETVVRLTNTQHQMFKTMTRSLAIPHFLYADEIDFTNLCDLRTRLNKALAAGGNGSAAEQEAAVAKLSYLPFIVKAVSMALYKYPVLNARVDTDPDPAGGGKPVLVHRRQHNIGVAIDSPQGLVVPVVRDVGSLNVLAIAAELVRLQGLAREGKLSVRDMSGGTITVSNIGNIGGTYLSPVIVEREVAILGVGRMRSVPAFDGEGKVVEKKICNFSWSADHRVVDGATMARAAEVVRSVVEEPDMMIMHLR